MSTDWEDQQLTIAQLKDQNAALERRLKNRDDWACRIVAEHDLAMDADPYSEIVRLTRVLARDLDDARANCEHCSNMRAQLTAVETELFRLREIANAVRVWRAWYPKGKGAHADNLAQRYDDFGSAPAGREQSNDR